MSKTSGEVQGQSTCIGNASGIQNRHMFQRQRYRRKENLSASIRRLPFPVHMQSVCIEKCFHQAGRKKCCEFEKKTVKVNVAIAQWGFTGGLVKAAEAIGIQTRADSKQDIFALGRLIGDQLMQTSHTRNGISGEFKCEDYLSSSILHFPYRMLFIRFCFLNGFLLLLLLLFLMRSQTSSQKVSCLLLTDTFIFISFY